MPLNSLRLCVLLGLGLTMAAFPALSDSQGRSREQGVSVEGFANNSNENSAFKVITALPVGHPDKIALGRALFFDKRLSGDGSVSCATCHALERGGTDRMQFSVGVRGMRGDVNAPTVFNSALNFRQFWDGRAATLEEQVDGPLTNPKEMASTWEDVIKKLQADETMQASFKSTYRSGPSKETISDAIATFERTLVTLNSPFDRYLAGDRNALSATQKQGMKKFQALGCVACHQGTNLGGNMYQKFGIVGDYFKERGGEYGSDLGRFRVTARESDRHVFRVPSLRNVELTAPYFHDGTAATLEDAVRVMAKFQLGRKLEKDDVAELVDFLRSLTGELPASAREVASP